MSSFDEPYTGHDGGVKYSLPHAAYPPPGGEQGVDKVREEHPEVAAWVDEFTSWSSSTQLLALFVLLVSLPLSLLTAVTAWIPQVHARDFVAHAPAKVVRNILLYLDMKTLAKATQVSSTWRAKAEDQILWRRYCETGWPLHVRARLARGLGQGGAGAVSDGGDGGDGSGGGAKDLVFWKDVFRERYVVDGGWDRGLFAEQVLEDAVPRRCLAVCGGELVAGGYTQVLVTDIESGKRTRTLETGHGSWIYSVAADADADFLATGSWDTTARLFKFATGEQTGVLRGHTGGIWSVSANLAFGLLATGSNDTTVRVWDLESAACVHTLEGHANGVYHVQALTDGVLGSPDALYVSCAADNQVKVWDVRAPRAQIATLKGHSDVVSTCQVDARTMISGSHDGLIKSWDFAMLGSKQDGSGPKPVAVFTGALHRIKCLQFDDAKIIGGSTDGTVRVWSRRSFGAAIAPSYTLYGHTSEVNACVFDDTKLCTSSRDNTVRVWSVVDDPELIAAHEAAAATLTPRITEKINTEHPDNPNPLTLSIVRQDGSPGSPRRGGSLGSPRRGASPRGGGRKKRSPRRQRRQ